MSSFCHTSHCTLSCGVSVPRNCWSIIDGGARRPRTTMDAGMFVQKLTHPYIRPGLFSFRYFLRIFIDVKGVTKCLLVFLLFSFCIVYFVDNCFSSIVVLIFGFLLSAQKKTTYLMIRCLFCEIVGNLLFSFSSKCDFNIIFVASTITDFTSDCVLGFVAKV